MLDALAYLKASRAVGAPAALELSRSGVGAHVWIFFTHPTSARTARQLGIGLVREAMALRGRMDLTSYDRLFPSQDVVSPGAPGNLIAAPLHGVSRKEHGTTVFLDLATLEPYADQWEYLSPLPRCTPTDVASIGKRLRPPSLGSSVSQLHHSRSTRSFPRASPVVHMTLDAQVRIRIDELNPAELSTLKHAASVMNPEIFARQRRRQSTWNTPQVIVSYSETYDGHLVLPRGLFNAVVDIIEEAGSSTAIDDQRSTGTTIELPFHARMSPRQQAAVESVAGHDLGVIEAPPGFGKTVVACAVMARYATSALIVVDSRALAEQWRAQISRFLDVKTGQIGGGRSKLTGHIDIAMLQTLARRDNLADKMSSYGLVVVDECHHIPAAAFEAAVSAIPARRWLGLTATPYRRDRLDDLIAFQLGPLRHTASAADPGSIEAVLSNAPVPRLFVHTTRFYADCSDPSAPGEIARVHSAVAADDVRNRQIVDDVADALSRARNCLVLTQRTAHVDTQATMLESRGFRPVILKGGMSVADRTHAIERLNDTSRPGPLLAVATGHFAGEGFDCPALDTLFLAAPISFKGRLVQYAGRIMRPHEGKTTADVHDYFDAHTPVLAASLSKRAPGYLSLGFPDPRPMVS